jgi:hypothetical protein
LSSTTFPSSHSGTVISTIPKIGHSCQFVAQSREAEISLLLYCLKPSNHITVQHDNLVCVTHQSKWCH